MHVEEAKQLLFSGETFKDLPLSEKMNAALTEVVHLEKPTRIQSLFLSLFKDTTYL